MAGIIVVQSHIENAKKLRNILRKFGYNQTIASTSMAVTLEKMQDFESGIIICPGRMVDGTYKDLYEMKTPYYDILLIGSDETIEQNEIAEVSTLLVPFRAIDLVYKVEAMTTSLEERLKRQKLKRKRTRQTDERIYVAKKLLMEKNDMSEPEAYRYIQKCSMDAARSMAETAEMIISIYG